MIPKETDSIQTLEETIGFLPSLDPWIKDASEKENLQFFPRFEEKDKKDLNIHNGIYPTTPKKAYHRYDVYPNRKKRL